MFSFEKVSKAIEFLNSANIKTDKRKQADNFLIYFQDNSILKKVPGKLFIIY
jgi:hypothetical protein